VVGIEGVPRPNPLLDSLKAIFLYAIWTASILFVVFKLMWGLNYQRLPIAEGAAFDDRYAKTEELNEIGMEITNGIRTSFSMIPANNPFAGAREIPLLRLPSLLGRRDSK
jgi:hypothetical protein